MDLRNLVTARPRFLRADGSVSSEALNEFDVPHECSDGYGARCSRCFSFLFAAVRGRKYLHVSLGVLVDAPSRVPDHHIYVGSKAPWYRINDALPQYDELP